MYTHMYTNHANGLYRSRSLKENIQVLYNVTQSAAHVLETKPVYCNGTTLSQNILCTSSQKRVENGSIFKHLANSIFTGYAFIKGVCFAFGFFYKNVITLFTHNHFGTILLYLLIYVKKQQKRKNK